MNILITGTSKGLGAGLSQRFLKEGHLVVGISRTHCEQGFYSNPNYHHLTLDLTEPNSSKLVVDELKKSTHTPNVVIFNAAKYHLEECYCPNYFANANRLNFIQPIELVLALKAAFHQAPITAVLISSVMAFIPDHKNFVYSSTKAGVSSAFANLQWNDSFSQFKFKTFYLGPFEASPKNKHFRSQKSVYSVSEYIADNIHSKKQTFYFPKSYRAIHVFRNFIPDQLLVATLKCFR
jgi:short-subunit dehydrogenase